MNKSRSKLISRLAAISALLCGILVIIGRFIHIDFEQAFVHGQVMMAFNIALGFVFSSIVILLNPGKKDKSVQFIAAVLSVAVFVIGVITLTDYIFGFDTGFDRLFFNDDVQATATTDHAGTMSPLSGFNFILTGIGLFLLNKEKAGSYQFYYLFAITFVSLLMLIGLNFIVDFPALIYLSFFTATGFIAISGALYFSQPMLQKKIGFERKLFTGFTAVIILIAVLSIFSFYYSDKRVTTSRLIEHTNNVLVEANETLSLMKDIESGGRGYIITGDSGYLKYFKIAKDDIFTHIKKLKELTKNNPSQQVKIDSLSLMLDKRVNLSMQAIEVKNKKGIEGVNKLIPTKLGKFYAETIRDINAEIQQEEKNVLAQRQEENERSITSFNHAFVILLAGVFLLLAIILFSISNNISIRKRAEAALTELNNELELKVIERTKKLASSEERFRSIIEQYPSPVVRYSPDGTYISANPAWEVMWEDKRENVVGYNIRKDPQMIASGLSKYIEKAFSGEVATSEVYQYDPVHIGKSGRKRWIQMLMYPLKDAEDHILEVVLIILDMTTNKEAEEKLDRNEKRFRALVENNEGIIALLDEKFHTIYRSPAAERITGWTHADSKILRSHEQIHPDDAAHVSEMMTQMMATPGKSLDITFRTKHKDGHYILLEGVFTNMIYDPSVGAIITNLRDITARKEAEENLIASEKRFRDTLDTMMEGAQIIGFDWRYKYVNDSMTRHGKYSKEELLDHTVMEKYPGIEQTDLFKIYQRCFDERVAIHLENQFTFPDKTTGWFELSFQPVDEGIFILSIDITERKKAEFEIQQLNEDLEQKIIDRTEQLETANKELEAFSYSVSHDLRAPLRAINGFSNLLGENYSTIFDAEALRLFSRIKVNAHKMGLLIDNLLEFSRLGRKEIHKSPIQMTELVETALLELNGTTNHKAAVKIHQLHPVDADSPMIKQVVINLLSNAIKYSSRTGNPAIEIKSYTKENEIIYCVSDNGIGFNNQFVHKLFGVFQRLHLQADFEGTGVGLALVKRIINKHGGRVWASGELNKGATFCFSLPATNNN